MTEIGLLINTWFGLKQSNPTIQSGMPKYRIRAILYFANYILSKKQPKGTKAVS
jgi:hypothetical protein